MTEPSLYPDKQIFNNKILTVTELNRLARNILEEKFPHFWLSGEVSNFTRAGSGHWYFSLKDSAAQVRCVMFKNRNNALEWSPKEGDKVEARGSVTLYEARGDFQLTIEFLQRAGLGALFEAFEKLKVKLQQEGLFNPALKKPLPHYPRKIGIVTSPDAAALRDVITVLKRRIPNIPLVIYPTPVQGKGAARLIANAINQASADAVCDVLIICRGGGSIEDLWQFNEEVVARAIRDCTIPTVSGIGHETDFTICDFVADIRAATPSAAAELASPSRDMLFKRLNQLNQQLTRNMSYSLTRHSQALDYLARRLFSPLQQIQKQNSQLEKVALRLNIQINQLVQTKRHNLIRLSQNLQHLNPQAVLERGYAFVQNSLGSIITSSQQLNNGEKVTLTFGEGSAEASIIKKQTKS